MRIFSLILCLFCSCLMAHSQIVTLDPLPDGGVRIAGGRTDVNLGFQVKNLGDISGDQRDDYAIAAPEADVVYVIYGRSTLPRTINLNFLATNGFVIIGNVGTGFGSSLAALGDVDRDGRNDFAIGAPNEGEGGRVYVFEGTFTLNNVFTSDLNRFLYVVEGLPGEILGQSLQDGEDINNDQFSELLIPSPNRSLTIDGQTSFGVAYVIYGAIAFNPKVFTTDNLPEQSLVIAASPDSFASDFARVFKAVDDFNGDGVMDAVLLNGLETSEDFVRSDISILSGIGKPVGQKSATDNSLSFKRFSLQFFDQAFQNAVGSIESSDIDGDGLNELIVGYPAANALSEDEISGAVVIIPGTIMQLGGGLIDRSRPVTIIGNNQVGGLLGGVVKAHDNLLALPMRSGFNPNDPNSAPGLVYILDASTLPAGVITDINTVADKIFLGLQDGDLFGQSVDFTTISGDPFILASATENDGVDEDGDGVFDQLGVSAFLLPVSAPVTAVEDYMIYE